MGNVWSLAIGKKSISADKRQTNKHLSWYLLLWLPLCSGSLSGSVEVSRLKMVSNEFNSLWKTFDIKIMSFFPVLKMLGRYCMKLYVKTDKKSRSMEKQVVSNYTLHFYLCKFVPFSFLLQTWGVHSEVSFIIYLALPMSPYFLLYVLW